MRNRKISRQTLGVYLTNEKSYIKEVSLNIKDLSIIYDALSCAENEGVIYVEEANELLNKLGLEKLY